MYLRVFLFASAALAVSPPAGRADPAPQPDRNAGLVCSKLLRLSSDPRACKGEAAFEHARAEFDRSLGVLAGMVSDHEAKRCEKLEGSDLRAKLVLIARDRRRRPQLYQELEARYTPVRDRRVAWAKLSYLPAREGDCVAGNRLAWEYYLLRPHTGYTTALHAETAAGALKRIGDEASLLALRHAFRAAWTGYEGGSPRAFDDLLISVRSALASYRSERGLRALLEAFAWMEGRLPQGKRPPDFLEPLRRLRFQFHEGEHKEQWSQVLRSFPRDGLPPDQRRLLEEALKPAKPAPGR